jgi:xanthine/CO dehydrogenase XdhC/CoxF family maturation factor
MVERRQIVEMARRIGDEAGVLVTLVRAEGSSYRRPGARLLTSAGSTAYAGTISGGCLENEVIKKAIWKVRHGAVVERYSTLFDDTAEIPYGLGCGGTIDLLLEAAGTPEFQALVDALEASLAGHRSTVLTWLPTAGRALKRAVIADTGEVLFRSVGLDPDQLSAQINSVLLAEIPDVFVEQLAPPQRLFVLGAGDDAKPVVSMADLLGWNSIVVDGRSHLARKERFPSAAVVMAHAEDLPRLGITPEDALVLMTHSYEQDRAWLAAVLPIAPRYLGVLGARHRSSLLVSEAAAMTGLSVAECCARIYAPVGLNLGGDGPEAIALSVIAEVQACCTGGLPSSRRLSAAEVTEQIAKGGASRYLQSCALNVDPDRNASVM